MTDEFILELIRHPSTRQEGFTHLVTKYQRQLYHVVRQRVTTHEDADDVLQNTFLKVFRHIHSFEQRSEIFTWMYRIACNEVSNHQKQFSKMKIVEFDKADAAMAEAFVDTTTLADSLEEMVAKLPQRQQMVFKMRYFDELSYKQMSEILNRSEGALKASFHHAVRKIEEEFRSKQIL